MVDFDKHAQERYNAYEATGGPANGGITVLDYFAGKAMAALLAASNGAAVSITEAYNVAELMLKERAKRTTPQGVVKGVTGKTYG